MIIGEFCDVYPPELDGVGTVVRNYAEQLSQLGEECYYIAPNNPDFEGNYDFQALFYKGFKMPSEPYHIGLPGLDLSYQAKQKKIDFDIVHAHSPFTAGMGAIQVARRRNIPLVGTFHSKYYDDFLSKTHSQFLANIGVDVVVNFFNKCDEVWAVSEKTSEVLREYGYAKEIFVMPNGTSIPTVSDEDVRAVCAEYSIPDEDTILLYVGQMNWKKNIRRTMEGFRLYIRNHDHMRLLMVGQGPDEDEIHALAEEEGLKGHVTFTGHIGSREKLAAIYKRSSLLLFPSIYDNASLVIREAAASGTPAVVMRGSCSSEGILDGINGLLCDDTDESIEECIGRGLANAESIGKEAQRTIPIPWKDILVRVRDRYRYLIEKHNVDGSAGL